ncbi:MAG: hypothetical protein ACPGRG_03610 [Marinomonas sp.]
MSDNITLSLEEVRELSNSVLTSNGFNDAHAQAITDIIYTNTAVPVSRCPKVWPSTKTVIPPQTRKPQ